MATTPFYLWVSLVDPTQVNTFVGRVVALGIIVEALSNVKQLYWPEDLQDAPSCFVVVKVAFDDKLIAKHGKDNAINPSQALAIIKTTFLNKAGETDIKYHSIVLSVTVSSTWSGPNFKVVDIHKTRFDRISDDSEKT